MEDWGQNGNSIYLRDVLSKTVAWITKFREVGDTLVQYDPGHAAVPWTAVRFVLQAAVNENEIHGAILEGVEQVSGLIARYTTVETLYLQTRSMERERLKGAIVSLYVTILHFLLYARRHFSRSTGRRFIGSIVQTSDMKVKPFLRSIAEAESLVKVIAQLVDAEYIQRTEQLLNGGFLGMNTRLDSISEDLHSLQGSLNRQAPRLESDRKMAIAWLSAVSTTEDYERAQAARLKKTCQWIREREEYQKWENHDRTSDHARMLWIHGSASFGKTILTSSIVQHLESKVSQAQKEPAHSDSHGMARSRDYSRETDIDSITPRSIVAYFFCSYEDEAKRQPTAILRSWLAQIVKNDDHALETVLALSKDK